MSCIVEVSSVYFLGVVHTKDHREIHGISLFSEGPPGKIGWIYV